MARGQDLSAMCVLVGGSGAAMSSGRGHGFFATAPPDPFSHTRGGWGFRQGHALTDGAPVAHCWGPPNRQAGAYGLKPGFWMAGARGRVLARAFACWACCAPPFEGSAWEHVAAAFCPGYGFLGGACDGNVASAAPGGLDVCGCGVWTACLYLAGDLWSRQPCDAASVTFFIHSGMLVICSRCGCGGTCAPKRPVAFVEVQAAAMRSPL